MANDGFDDLDDDGFGPAPPEFSQALVAVIDALDGYLAYRQDFDDEMARDGVPFLSSEVEQAHLARMATMRSILEHLKTIELDPTLGGHKRRKHG